MAFTTGFWEAGLEGTVARMNQCLLGYGPKADFPAAAAGNRGMQAYATDENIVYYSDGAAWVEVARGETVTRLAQLSEKAHGSLTGVGASDHHVKTTDAGEITSGRFGMPRMPDGTAGLVLTAKGASADPAFTAPDHPQKLKPALTRWVTPGWYMRVPTSSTATAELIYYIPIFVEETTTYIRIGTQVATAAAGTADLRIFAWDNGLPGALILSAGTVDTGTTGYKEITISQQLTRGYYFLAIRCSAAPDLRGPDDTQPVAPPVAGFNTAGPAPSDYPIQTVAAAFADPAPAPTDGVFPHCAYVRLREN